MTTGNFNALKQALATANTLCIGDIFTDTKTKRIHIMFAEKPCETMRQTLKSHGFGWYPKQGTWSKNWSTKDEEFARTFVRQCNSNVNKTNTTTVINFPKKSDAPKMSTAELEQVKAVADTVKVPAKAVKRQVKAVKAVKTAPAKVQTKTNVKKVNTVTERDGIKIGDIFAESCGYSMTYYDFYRVIGFKGQKTVIFAPICKKTVSGDGMCGEVVPVNKFAYNRYNICGTVEKIIKTGGENPTFKGREYFFRHREGRTYYENHLD